MLRMILRRFLFKGIGRVAGGQAARNVKSVSRAARLARRLGR